MNNQRILVWDLPVRLFHWLLVAAFAGAWLTAESERWRDVHVLLGYTTLALVAFRLLWGFAGSRYARFGSFAAGPSRVGRYLASLLRPAPERHIGHNPAGGWAIFLLLALTLLTALTGYMNYQDIGGRLFEDLHEGAATAMLVVAGVHVAGVIFSSFLHRENLVKSMLTGMKEGQPAQGIGKPRRIVAATLLLALAGLWTMLLQGNLPSLYDPAPTVQASAGQAAAGHAGQSRHHHDDD